MRRSNQELLSAVLLPVLLRRSPCIPCLGLVPGSQFLATASTQKLSPDMHCIHMDIDIDIYMYMYIYIVTHTDTHTHIYIYMYTCLKYEHDRARTCSHCTSALCSPCGVAARADDTGGVPLPRLAPARCWTLSHLAQKSKLRELHYNAQNVLKPFFPSQPVKGPTHGSCDKFHSFPASWCAGSRAAGSTALIQCLPRIRASWSIWKIWARTGRATFFGECASV